MSLSAAINYRLLLLSILIQACLIRTQSPPLILNQQNERTQSRFGKEVLIVQLNSIHTVLNFETYT